MKPKTNFAFQKLNFSFDDVSVVERAAVAVRVVVVVRMVILVVKDGLMKGVKGFSYF